MKSFYKTKLQKDQKVISNTIKLYLEKLKKGLKSFAYKRNSRDMKITSKLLGKL